MKLKNILHLLQNTLHVRVTPKASTNRIKIEEQANGQFLIRVYVTTVPEDGKANEAVIALLAKELGVAKSCLTIIRGHTGKDKVIALQD